MGNAFYHLADGRDAGYGVDDTCSASDCNARIDRGLAHLCGTEPGRPEEGCGDYFCGEHLWSSGDNDDTQRCAGCLPPT